ncbi:MAG TPA: hypothetical protein VND93_01040 [Myxococcales bacterium]|nr:hypothetical protein [Myxococcales bacterium]
MRRLSTLAATLLALVLTACGGGATPARALQMRLALTSPPELLEFESLSARQEMFREMAHASQSEAGQPASASVLFPISHGADQLVAAPGFELRSDLLQAPDAGQMLLSFDPRGGERWPEDRRDSLMGLSEREVAELVARTLLSRWGVQPAGTVDVDRATGAPYAAAYVDGILRLNPSLLYLAASVGASSAAAQ